MENKPAIQSQTIINAVIGFLVLVSALSGLDLDEGIITELVMGIAGVITLIGVILGRVKASKNIVGVITKQLPVI